MANEFVVTLDAQNRTARFLVGEQGAPFIAEGATIKRASHVEPANAIVRGAFHVLRRVFGDKGTVAASTRKWPVLWRVNLTPVEGPILPTLFLRREEAISTEVAWLNENFI